MKKILALCLVVVLAITAVTGATLAYFTDSDKAENVVTIGNVKIEQMEQERDGSEFVQDQNIVPAVLNKLTKSKVTVNGYSFDIRSTEGNYIDKIVSVKNTGTNPAYIRTIVAVPSINGFDDDPDATFNPLHWNYLDASDFKGVGYDWNGSNDAWQGGNNYAPVAQAEAAIVRNVTIGDITYDVYVGTYNTAVEAGKIAAPAMVGFYLDEHIDYGKIKVDGVETEKVGYFQEYTTKDGQDVYRDLSTYMTPGDDGKVELKILVASQACQTNGFTDAWEALDTAFGKIDEAAVKALFE